MKYLSITQVAQLLGLSTSTLYKKTSARSIPFFKLGGRVLFDPEVLERWIRSHAVQPIGYAVDFMTEEDHDAA
jgi:excisionase family DNA binding protein